MWEGLIAGIALIFSIVCFGLFVRDALKKPKPEEVADRVGAKMAANAGLDPRILAEMAKALADALSKVGPGLVALIGAVLFLLLSGEAADVYDLTGNATEANAADTNSAGGEGDQGAGSNETDAGAGDNGSDVNATGNSG